MTTTQKTNKQVPGLDEAMVSGLPVQALEISVGEDKGFTLTYRTMSWLDKSACVALATELFLNADGKPQSMFHIDIYFREALKKMLVEFPWPVSDKVLNGLTPEIGTQLQAIIPAPLGDDAGNLVKGSETPSKAAKKTRSSKDKSSS